MTAPDASRKNVKIQLLDLKAQHAAIRDDIAAAVAEVFDSQRFIMGPKVEECERAIAGYCSCAYGIGVSSGTDALLASLMAENIGPGDEVITTPYTFFATAGSIARTGATPVFVDIERDTFNIDPSLIEARVTEKTRAVMPVHLFGRAADMDPAMEIAGRHGLVVIEDAAQAIGAEYKGQRAGSIGHYGCFSFFPSKNLGGAGDGGMVVTNDTDRAERLRVLRDHGASPKYHHGLVGGNFRLDALQAAVVLVKLGRLDAWTGQRAENASRYGRLFAESGLPGNATVRLPSATADRHTFNQYAIRVSRRDELKTFLAEQDVATEIYYPVPLHLQGCFAHLGYKAGDFPESEEAAAESLALPVYPELTDEQAGYVVGKIGEFFG